MMSTFRLVLLVLVVVSVGCAHKPNETAPVTSASAPGENVPEPMKDAVEDPTSDITAVPPVKSAAVSAAGSNEQIPAGAPVAGKDESSVADGQIEDVYLDDDLDFLDEELEEEIYAVSDPLAPWNRMMFNFNDKLYFWFLKPVSSGYVSVVPSPVRSGISNFFDNLSTPIRMTSSLLQGNGTQAQAEFARFLFNTTFGVFGFGSPADDYPHLTKKDEDLGQALGAHGVGNGWYVVWPFLGPSTFRDTVGTVGDAFMNPVTYLPLGASMGITGEKKLNETSYRIGDYETLKEASIDPYEALRDAYLQHRQTKVED